MQLVVLVVAFTALTVLVVHGLNIVFSAMFFRTADPLSESLRTGVLLGVPGAVLMWVVGNLMDVAMQRFWAWSHERFGTPLPRRPSACAACDGRGVLPLPGPD